jgi:hypothetical protein
MTKRNWNCDVDVCESISSIITPIIFYLFSFMTATYCSDLFIATAFLATFCKSFLHCSKSSKLSFRH